MRHPPSPTPFPYTTLFRSDRARQALRHRVGMRRVLQPDAVAQHGAPRRGEIAHLGGELTRLLAPSREFVRQGVIEEHDGLAEDRKSTRLNSSHPSISYAVF